MRTPHAIKVQSGPGTAGYDRLTPKQREKKNTWARFATYLDAVHYAEALKTEHTTWIITVETDKNA